MLLVAAVMNQPTITAAMTPSNSPRKGRRSELSGNRRCGEADRPESSQIVEGLGGGGARHPVVELRIVEASIGHVAAQGVGDLGALGVGDTHVDPGGVACWARNAGTRRAGLMVVLIHGAVSGGAKGPAQSRTS